MGGKSSPPPAPDYQAAAQATAKGDLEAARYATTANRPNLYTPFGNQTWANHGGDKWSSTVTVAPELQRALTSQQNVDAELSGKAQQMLGQVKVQGSEFDMSDVQEKGDPGFGAVGEVQQAMMGRMREDLDYRRDGEIARLKAQGITEGSEAWNNAMRQLDRGENDASQQALLAATGEADRMYGRQTSARSRDIQEQAYLRGLPIQELNALLRGTDVGMPQFQQYATQATTSGPNMLGAASAQHQGALDAYNAKQAASGNFMDGLLGVGKLGISAYTGGMFG